MPDTQWPRFYVFKQDAEGEPHLNCGTVHAPDAEFALMNARDVFVRRPDCHSLWVVPEDQVFSFTTDELQESEAGASGSTARSGGPVGYHVFQKKRKIGSHTWVGKVESESPAGAYQEARRAFESEDVGVWLVVPEHGVTATGPDEAASWFGPASDKPYRHHSFYHTQTLMLDVKRGADDEDEDEG